MVKDFRQDGTMDCARDRLKIPVNTQQAALHTQSFGIHPRRPSGPAAFLGLMVSLQNEGLMLVGQSRCRRDLETVKEGL